MNLVQVSVIYIKMIKFSIMWRFLWSSMFSIFKSGNFSNLSFTFKHSKQSSLVWICLTLFMHRMRLWSFNRNITEVIMCSSHCILLNFSYHSWYQYWSFELGIFTRFNNAKLSFPYVHEYILHVEVLWGYIISYSSSNIFIIFLLSTHKHFLNELLLSILPI